MLRFTLFNVSRGYHTKEESSAVLYWSSTHQQWLPAYTVGVGTYDFQDPDE